MAAISSVDACLIASTSDVEHGAPFRKDSMGTIRRWSITLLLVLLWHAQFLLCHGSGENSISSVGFCEGGALPQPCNVGELARVDWAKYLGILCMEEVERAVAATWVSKVLARFDQDSAHACMSGFIVTMLALYGAALPEWEDHAVRFLPDGQMKILISSFDDQEYDTKFKQYTVTLPSTFSLEPPFPRWPFPGQLTRIRQAQDLASMTELPAMQHCRMEALKVVGCGDDPAWAELLQLLCSHCRTEQDNYGLPCLYTSELLKHVERLLELHRSQTSKGSCPHGLLAAILSLAGQTDLSPPDVSPTIYRVRKLDGKVVDVLHSSFKQVAQVPKNYFAFNIPMLDLSPFPFHTAMLRSARINAAKDISYYKAFVGEVSSALARAGLPHVLLPGDKSESWTKEHVDKKASTHSIFVPHHERALLSVIEAFMMEALQQHFGGVWRLVRVSEGLWQIGEEPYRFSPREGVAFRVFCSQCMYVSIYFYLRNTDRNELLPLAPWMPCSIPVRRVFPSGQQRLGEATVPMAADETWLQRAQRSPSVWLADATALGATAEHAGSCRRAREQLAREHGLARTPSIITPLLTPGFDLSAGIHAGLGLYEIMRLREESENLGQHCYSDKIQFKTRLMRQGVPIPKIFYMSNRAPDVLDVLQSLGTERYVAKPTHLAATSFVFVMRDGINLLNGKTTNKEEVAAGLVQSWQDRHLDDWATESTPRGVIVEELIDPPPREGSKDSTPDELKCQTFFGELFFCEWVYVSNMTTGEDGAEKFKDAFEAGDRAQPSLGHKACGIPNFQWQGYVFRDGTCFGCEQRVPLSAKAWSKLVEMVESVAEGTDHIRIDVFITPDGKPVINEANISFLKISKFPAALVEEMRRRWLDGYRMFYS